MTLPCFPNTYSALLKHGCRSAIAVFTGLLTSVCFAQTLQIAITETGNRGDVKDPAYYFENMLILALNKTRASDGDYTLVHKDHGGGIARDRAMLIAGAGIDIMWASVTTEREQQMRVIPVDLLKNLNNYRVLLINKDAQQTFTQVQTLDDLKKFTVGSGEHWTDGSIMKSNGFNVAVTSSYSGLFKMLAARRFNFISRGLHEVGYDVQTYKGLDLVQETNLLLAYDTPIRYCFFVNKNNQSLADRVERGLKIAQQDGSFDELFYRIPSFKEGEELLKNSHRRQLFLRNTKSN
jgi:hypothetical protein